MNVFYDQQYAKLHGLKKKNCHWGCCQKNIACWIDGYYFDK